MAEDDLSELRFARLTMPEPPLTDDTILLRPPEPDDIDAVYRHCQDPLIGTFTAIPQPYEKSDAVAYVEKSDSDWECGRAATFSVLDDGQLVGSIAVFRKEYDLAIAEVGYWIAPEARGCGIATRALILVSRWAFDAMDIARLQLGANRANAASHRVAEKAGFKLEGLLRSWREIRGNRVDEVHFSLLPEDLSAQPDPME